MENGRASKRFLCKGSNGFCLGVRDVWAGSTLAVWPPTSVCGLRMGSHNIKGACGSLWPPDDSVKKHHVQETLFHMPAKLAIVVVVHGLPIHSLSAVFISENEPPMKGPAPNRFTQILFRSGLCVGTVYPGCAATNFCARAADGLA